VVHPGHGGAPGDTAERQVTPAERQVTPAPRHRGTGGAAGEIRGADAPAEILAQGLVRPVVTTIGGVE